MTALTLTAQNTTASVLVQITGAPAGAVIITRSDANGTNLVRLLDGQEPIAGVLTITDYEPALLGIITYYVEDSADVVTDASVEFVGLTNAHLVVPVLPLYRSELTSVTGYNAGRESGGTVHQIIGRQDNLPVMRKGRLREGILEIRTSDYSEARGIADLLSIGEVVLLKQPEFPKLDMYFVANRTTVNPLDPTTQGRPWEVVVDYFETLSPTGALLSAADWSFGDVAADYDTFSSVKVVFPTFDDLLVGP